MSSWSPTVRVEADRVTTEPAQLGDPRRRQPGELGDLVELGRPVQGLQQLASGAGHLGDLLVDVHGEADGAGQLGQPAADGLTDPPHGVGRELEALGVVELLDSADQADVAFLDDVAERHAAVAELLGDRHDQPQVGAQHVVLGGGAVLGDQRQVATSLGGDLLLAGLVTAQQLGGIDTGLDAP